MKQPRLAAAVSGLLCLIAIATNATAASAKPFIAGFSAAKVLSSTVPANGDQNPYGIVTVPRSAGKLHRGDILVSNFNNQGPLNAMGMPAGGGNQGEGTTIVQFDRNGGHPRLFAQIASNKLPDGVGLTTALAALPAGFVVVGSLPTSDGKSSSAGAGGLLVLNSSGHVVKTITGGLLNGPWDMTTQQKGSIATLYVTNVLNGTVAASSTTLWD